MFIEYKQNDPLWAHLFATSHKWFCCLAIGAQSLNVPEKVVFLAYQVRNIGNKSFGVKIQMSYLGDFQPL